MPKFYGNNFAPGGKRGKEQYKLKAGCLIWRQFSVEMP